MCEYIVQHALSTDFLGLLVRGKTLDSSTERATLSTLDHSLHPVTTSVPCDRKSVIKPNMQVSAIRQRDGQLECIKVRWGWSPVWSMGTLPPRTHLPLHLVMRSKVFDRMRGEDRVLVAVDGWYEATADDPSLPGRRFSYTTSRQTTPIFLAALAQISERSSGCDGLVLMTCDDTGGNHQRLLAFGADNALEWLRPQLAWEQAQQMAIHMAVDEPQLEHILTSQRMLKPSTEKRV